MLNRYLIFDVLESRRMHIGYDSKASAARAVNKMRKQCGNPSRYYVIDQRIPDIQTAALRQGALNTLVAVAGKRAQGRK